MDLVDLVNLFNSAEIYKNTRRIKETNHRGALRPCGAQPKAALMLSLLNMIILCLDMGILHIIICILCLLG